MRFRHMHRYFFSLAALCILASCVASSPASRQIDGPAAIRLQAAQREGFSGFALGVKRGTTVLAGGVGQVSPTAPPSFTSTTPFPISSVTKQFTRVGILLLEQENRIAVSDSIGKWIPELPGDKRGITIQQLINMRGGLSEYHDRDGDPTPGDFQKMDLTEALRRIGEPQLRFAPGTAQAYSNSGYTLLALIIERASGQSFEQFVRDRMLEPAGMKNTSFYGDRRWKRGSVSRASGNPRYMDNAPEDWPDVSWVLRGSGGMISTADDLGRWIHTLRSQRILKSAALAKHYNSAEWSFYAGANSMGYETDILEWDNGASFLVMHSNAGMGKLPLAISLAEAVNGAPLPEGLAQRLAQLTGSGPRTGPGSGVSIAVDTGPPRNQGQPSNDPAARALRAMLAAFRANSDEALSKFVTANYAPALLSKNPIAHHMETLRKVRSVVQSATTMDVRPVSPGVAELAVHSQPPFVIRVSASGTGTALIDDLVVNPK